jgi:hypothetical protein
MDGNILLSHQRTTRRAPHGAGVGRLQRQVNQAGLGWSSDLPETVGELLSSLDYW